MDQVAPIREPHANVGRFDVSKLERSAEELSAGGSDIGEEIRKMNELSRQSSIQSSHNGDFGVIRPSVMERMSSLQSARRNSSRRSMEARYSPSGRYMWSPTATSMSASWSQLPAPQPSHIPQLAASESSIRSRDSSVRYDEVAGQIQESLQYIPPWEHNMRGTHGSHYGSSQHRRSMDTFQEAQVAFRDFDGVHYSPDTQEYVETDQNGNGVRRISMRSSSGRQSLATASLLPTSRAIPQPRVVPPPAEGMAYYPAPVPRMLNLPKRLSQLPAATVQSKRRTQMLADLSKEAGAAAPWLSPGQDAQRLSMSSEVLQQNAHVSSSSINLPPHARAELYFNHRSGPQNVELKSSSAVATLDSILEASATAPIGAFIDHPFAGDVRKSVYSVERTPPKNSTNSTPDDKTAKRRSASITSMLRKAINSDDTSEPYEDRDVQRSPTPKPCVGPRKLQKRRSRMSLGADVGMPGGVTSDSAVTDIENRDQTEGQDIDEDFKEAEINEDVEGDAVFVKPSTLLAELQIRKAEQKSRGRTAVTAFPNGMHSTLLELDAVQRTAQQKRRGQRITLAWEDPSQRAMQQRIDTEEENVPLGVLYTVNDGLTHHRRGDGNDWDRPLGLLERRDLENEESLSDRRNRLRGIFPREAQSLRAPESLINDPANEVEVQNDEDETLAQRSKRMKAQSTPESTQEPSESRGPLSNEFVSDVLSQIANLGVKDNPEGAGQSVAPPESAPSPHNEDETLGQRKARLQRERAAQGRHANPLEHRQTSSNYEPSKGTLLHANAEAESRQKAQIQNFNSRMPSNAFTASSAQSLSYDQHTPNSGMNPPMNYSTPTLAMHAAPHGHANAMAHPVMQQWPLLQYTPQWMSPAAYSALQQGIMSPPTASHTVLGNSYNLGMIGSTYAAHAQRSGAVGGSGLAVNGAHASAQNRTNVDRWRLDVQS